MFETGTDYIAVKSGRPSKKRRWISIVTICLGLILLILGGGYYVYASIARSDLSNLEYPRDSDQDRRDSGLSANKFAQLYPGKVLPGLYWNDPRWTDVQYYDYASALEGFRPVEVSSGSPRLKDLSSPVRIEIPSLSIDSSIKALEIKEMGNVRAWETPKNIVGHIPTTANPGENGTVYLFGHLQSPLRGEGSVFRDLPQIPVLLRQGEEVYLILHNTDQTEFLYEVTHTNVVKASSFRLDETDSSVVTLVSCVPKYVYDHRLLVTASLVGIKT
tara:strand:- start:248 stop:1069 length:822 start_codon:yes stop_codon:yes gene_type:complete